MFAILPCFVHFSSLLYDWPPSPSRGSFWLQMAMDTVAVHSCPVCDKKWTVLKAYLQSAISSEWWYIYTSAACYACDKYSCTFCDKNSSSSDSGFYDFLIIANAEWESQKLNAKISSALLQLISLLVVANIYPKWHRFTTSSWPSKLWMHPKFVPIDRALLFTVLAFLLSEVSIQLPDDQINTGQVLDIESIGYQNYGFVRVTSYLKFGFKWWFRKIIHYLFHRLLWS